jgi:hypothetical protein
VLLAIATRVWRLIQAVSLLRDEGDNHVFELAVGGGVDAIITNNVVDFRSADLRFSGMRLPTLRDVLKDLVWHIDDSDSRKQA